MASTLEELLADPEQETVTLPSGRVVVLRALNLAEVREALAHENYAAGLTAASMVDPPMTPEQAALWLERCPAGDNRTVQATISRLSALGEGAGKSGVSADRDGPGDGE